jgi:hypothetical protein
LEYGCYFDLASYDYALSALNETEPREDLIESNHQKMPKKNKKMSQLIEQTSWVISLKIEFMIAQIKLFQGKNKCGILSH